MDDNSSGLVVKASDPRDAARLRAAGAWLEGYVPKAAEVRAAIRAQAMPQSPLAHMKKLKRPQWHDGYAAIRAASADDHLLSLAGMLTSERPIPRTAVFTVLRGALEADGWAFWSLAHECLNPERRRRLAIDRLFTVAEQRRVTSGQLRDTRRVTLALRQAGRRGVLDTTRQAYKNKKQPHRTKFLRDVLRRVRPKTSAVITEILKPWDEPADRRPRGDLLYQVVSGYAHGEVWAQMMGHAAGPDPAEHGFSNALLTLQVDPLLTSLGWTVRAHERVVSAYSVLGRLDIKGYVSQVHPIPVF